jgi:hypothetical protein
MNTKLELMAKYLSSLQSRIDQVVPLAAGYRRMTWTATTTAQENDREIWRMSTSDCSVSTAYPELRYLSEFDT